ncbi:MAG TPA: L,D-transpeptidase family protein, partial [Pyrinomonadaceae bacterium]|nr:L,D-transpeptidase family protein [Pyrinomonadaceae bacterium]
VTTGNSNANLSNNVSSITSESRSDVPVTMPVIDAMFADEGFAQAVRTAVSLTDEELTKVKNAAREAVLQLNGDPAEDARRSTKSTTESTRRDLESLIGKQKAGDLIAFVQSRWAGDTQSQPVGEPNSVPTDSRVVVNAPAYRMDVFRDGKLTKTYKIGIGYPEFPLPTGLREAKEIIFNPSWTPPDEPWVKGKFSPGKKVEAGSKLNPLGLIKIPIGLPSLIHGGKDPARLGTFASHGCVGLTNSMVQDFALEIAALGGTSLSLNDVKAHAKTKDETKNVKLTSPVPVELRYETIVVEDGKVRVFRDVYELGTNTEENLRKVLSNFGVSFDSLSDSEKSELKDAILRMAVDAKGNMVAGNAENGNNSSGRVTRSIKGAKEVVVDVAALKGKGYPAPVGLVQK